jgi:hypothetical protein
MSKSIRLTYYGVEADGPTVTAAKQAAGKRLEHLPRDVQRRLRRK